jgi:hypothetical protein
VPFGGAPTARHCTDGGVDLADIVYRPCRPVCFPAALSLSRCLARLMLRDLWPSEVKGSLFSAHSAP